MKSQYHATHVRVSHNDCQECRSECERQFLRPKWEGYQFVSEYLAWVRPRLEATRAGVNGSANWHQDFVKTLQRRITLKGSGETGRKQNDSYLQRLGQFPRSTDAAYLRRFARRGASTLN